MQRPIQRKVFFLAPPDVSRVNVCIGSYAEATARFGIFRHRFIAEAVLLVLARAVNPAGPCRITEAAFFVGKTQLSVQEEKHLDLSALLKVVLMGREVRAAVVSYTADLRTSC